VGLNNKVKISPKKIKKLAEEGKLRDNIELWVDKHNHKTELVRTLTGIIGLVMSSIIMLRVFNVL
jgi:hypothetical protein